MAFICIINWGDRVPDRMQWFSLGLYYIYLCIKNVFFYHFHRKKDFAFFTIEKSPFFLKELNKFIFIYAFNIFSSIFNYIRCSRNVRQNLCCSATFDVKDKLNISSPYLQYIWVLRTSEYIYVQSRVKKIFKTLLFLFR